MKKLLLTIAIVGILSPGVSQGATVAELEVQHIRLLEQIVTLLQARLQELLALRGLPFQFSGASYLTGFGTTTSSSTPVVKKKKSGGGGGGGRSNSSNLARETACRIAGDLKIAPTETKVAYIAEVAGVPIYASWAPDTTKELHDYLVAYLRNYEATGRQYYTHIPDYTYEYAIAHIPVLESRLTEYFANAQVCAEEIGPYTFVPFVPATTTPPIGFAKLEIGLSDSNPDSSILAIDEDSVSGWYSILVFDIDSEDSTTNVQISTIPLTLTVEAEGRSLGDLVNDVEIVIDGETYGDWSYATGTNGSTTAVVVFGTDGHTLNLNEQITVEVLIRFKALSLESATIQSSITANNVLAIEANGIGTSTVELSGSAIGEVHTLLTKGIVVYPSDKSAAVTQIDGSLNDYAEYSIEVEIEAFESDIYISTNPALSVSHTLEDSSGSSSVSGTQSIVLASTADEELDAFVVREGDAESFLLTVFYSPQTPNIPARLKLNSINFGVSPTETTSHTWAALPAEDYRTNTVIIVD